MYMKLSTFLGLKNPVLKSFNFLRSGVLFYYKLPS